MKNLIKYIILLVVITLTSCEAELDLPPVDEFEPESLFQSEEGIEAVLFSAYNFDRINTGSVKNEILMNEVSTDMSFVRIGAVEREMSPFLDFNWDSSDPILQNAFWTPRYRGIRDANTVIENIESSDVSESNTTLFRAEARYIRAAQYAHLYRYFGVVPLRTTTNLNEQPQALPLPSQEEFFSFVEAELRESANNLPHPSEQTQWGRATKGHAYAILTKFFMNTRQWEKVVEATDLLMELNYYELYPDYRGTFFVENEGNREIIVTYSYRNEQGQGLQFQNGAFPPGFLNTASVPEFEWTTSMANWPTQFSLRDGFVESFNPEDDRKQAVIEQYQNRGGNMVDLRTTPDNSRSLKFWDNNQVGNFSGADFPFIRYADILLSRAEALNEINGPTQEALDLVNEVRTRSIDDPYTMSDAGSTEALRGIILEERGWEFYSEGKRREDLVRHNKFIEFARDRGLNASEHQIFFPYPQEEVNANPALEQREGY